jgi:parallel beta-helix repeat protein
MADKYKQVTNALLSTIMLLLATHQAQAQTTGTSTPIASSSPYNQSIATQQANSFQVLHVSPLAGDDLYGNGQQHQPFKTITHALAVAEPNTVILLTPGRYTTETGETFPLVLRPGVTLQGNTSSAQSAIIVGGGTYQSSTLSRQNVTVVATDRSGMANLVVSNPNDQGTGLWVEAGNPIIRDSGLVANRHTGIYVVSGNPVIEGNYFLQNQVAGLVIYGDSAAQLRSNHFEGNRTALTISETSTPTIVGNRIIGNGEGVVLLGNARPNLENNTITNNQRNGVVEVASASRVPQQPPTAPELTPELSEPTPELIARTTPEPVTLVSSAPSTPEPMLPPAVPVAVLPTAPLPTAPLPTAPLPTAPLPTTPTVTNSSENSPAVPPAASPEPIRVSPAPRVSEPRAAEPIAVTPAQPAVVSQPPAILPPVQQVTVAPSRSPVPAPAQPVEVDALPSLPSADRLNSPGVVSTPRAEADVAPSQSIASTPSPTPERAPATASSIPLQVVPAGGSSRSSSTRTTRSGSTANASSRDSQPPAATNTESAARPVTPTRSADWLPVPDSDVPISSSGGGLNFSLAAMELPADGSPPAPPSRASILGLNYRVLVEASSAEEQNRVRELVPDAFRTQRNGRSLMQAGAYDNEATAQERMQLLLDNGLEARVEYTP